MPSNKLKILRNRVMQRREGSESEVVKDKKEILKEQRAKRRVEV